MTKWPAPVIRLFLGQLTPEAVLAAANESDVKSKQDRVCDANFYSGELALQQGQKDSAARLFRLASADCPKDSDELWAANVELKALGEPRSPPQAADCAAAETHWKSAEAIGTREVYEDHLKRFPTCAFATLAKARIVAL